MMANNNNVFLASAEWQEIVELRNLTPREFLPSVDSSDVNIQALIEVAEDNVIEFVIPLGNNNCAGSESFWESLRILLEKDTDFRKLLLVYGKIHYTGLGSRNIHIEKVIDTLHGDKLSSEVIILAALMLHKNVILYEPGCPPKLPSVTVYNFSADKHVTKNTLLLYAQNGYGKVSYFPMRIVSNCFYSSYGKLDSSTINCFKAEEVFIPTIKKEPGTFVQTGNPDVVELSSSDEELDSHNSGVDDSIPSDESCKLFIKLVHGLFVKKKGDQQLQHFKLSSENATEILKLIPDAIVSMTRPEIFAPHCKSLATPSQFPADRLSRNRHRLKYIPRNQFQLVESRPDGCCLLRCLSLHVFGTENHHYFLRLLCILVILQNYEELYEAANKEDMVLESSNLGRVFSRLCTVEFDSGTLLSTYYPGTLTIIAMSRILKQHICVINGTIDQDDQVKTDDVWLAYDKDYPVSANGIILLLVDNHYDLLLPEQANLLSCKYSQTVKGSFNRLTGEKCAFGIEEESALIEDGRNIVKFKMGKETDMLEQIKAHVVKGQTKNICTAVHVVEVPQPKPEILKAALLKLFQSTEFRKCKMDAMKCIKGVSILRPEKFRNIQKASPFVQNEQLLKNFNSGDSLNQYTQLEARFGRFPANGTIAYTFCVFEHTKLQFKSFLHELKSVSNKDIRNFYGIFGSIYPLSRPSHPISQIVVNVGLADIVILEICSKDIPTFYAALKEDESFNAAFSPANTDCCNLFCTHGKLMVARDFLSNAGIFYRCVVIQPNGSFICGFGSLLQISCLGPAHFQIGSTTEPLIRYFEDEEHIKSFSHECHVNPNYFEELLQAWKKSG